MPELQDELRSFMVDHLGAGDADGWIAPDADLIRGGVVDSLGLQQILEFLRARYGVAVANDELVLDNFRTLDQIAALVERKRRPRPRSRAWALRVRRA
jgi:methoxymalonate biosynthesis acyl carrier protein